MTKKQSLIGLGVLIALFAAVTYFVGRPLIAFVSEPEKFRLWVDGHGFWGRLAFLGMMVLQVVVAVIPGEPLEIGAGYAFGPWEGMFWCLLGAAIGSVIICAFTRKWGLKAVETFFPVEKIQSLKFLNTAEKRDILVFILFFIPGTPKDLLTYCVWLTPMKLSSYLLITSVARIPSVITSTMTGHALGTQNYASAIWIFALTAVVSGLGLWIYKRITDRQNKQSR